MICGLVTLSDPILIFHTTTCTLPTPRGQGLIAINMQWAKKSSVPPFKAAERFLWSLSEQRCKPCCEMAVLQVADIAQEGTYRLLYRKHTVVKVQHRWHGCPCTNTYSTAALAP